MSRKKKILKNFIIYKTTNIITNKFYIGRHATSIIEDGYFGSGRSLHRSIKKYGKENHIREILEFCQNQEELMKRESEIVTEELLKDKNCMNLCLGGGFGFHGPHLETTKNQISKFFSGKKYEELHENPELEKKKRADGVKNHWASMTEKEREARKESLKNRSKSHPSKGLKQKTVQCPHCLKEGGISAMKKNHFIKCKLRPLEINNVT
jgi:hypothetical protein